ncbi:tRNA (adenosine(37)-N6)-threonylcarbamoyltransferase complex dimerization subunit type 1 TsaB [Moraxella sp. ZY210820]|uniref:tRNA (adenosine(37)-N6)-threonylcarbamoyltransferase complex dimerization subunit type 1 TsaB n=1 Tax=unclassified Moraxella TaxID=2685852 RepID=UPI0027304B2A|nr:tRNA (adenosine(37)-N6)-threonylcarbamoyltransferase complex dimerization subunit type 1 TsaB [Moraxella sp. ZY210820]WLF84132.1 tRNA (adenosine(37)-N6)-threonylcarbamoyltransferase complex dimerization subunit type 1 TsaB [Moraxella sp. ZY210820]
MRLLALETANEYCSIAFYEQQQCRFFQLDERTKMQTQVILPMIEQGLTHCGWSFADLSAIAFSRGPGSFSGVRINATVAQALAWANDIPVISVSTLQALAQHAYQQQNLSQVSAIIDARMNEVYLANFSCDSRGIMQAIDNEQLLDYPSAQHYAQFTAVGSGAKFVQDDTAFTQLMPTAHDIAQIALKTPTSQWLKPEQALPVYLRNDAWKKINEQGKNPSTSTNI